MPHKTKINWCDYASNPIKARVKATGRGGHYCEPVSAGCANCYASRMQSPYLSQLPFSKANRDKVELFLDEKELHRLVRSKTISGKRVFVEDMSDLFGEWVCDDWLDRLFGYLFSRPDVTFCLLTKRPENIGPYFERLNRRRRGYWHEHAGYLADVAELSKAQWRAALRHYHPEPATSETPLGDTSLTIWPLPNVWLGASVENQAAADTRIPILFQIPATLRFLSVEPMLSELSIRKYLRAQYGEPGYCFDINNEWCYGPGSCPNCARGIDWVIVGGESGPGCRPCNPDWIRSVVAQCRAAGVPVWVKQDSGPKPGMQGTIPDDLWNTKELPYAIS